MHILNSSDVQEFVFNKRKSWGDAHWVFKYAVKKKLKYPGQETLVYDQSGRLNQSEVLLLDWCMEWGRERLVQIYFFLSFHCQWDGRAISWGRWLCRSMRPQASISLFMPCFIDSFVSMHSMIEDSPSYLFLMRSVKVFDHFCTRIRGASLSYRHCSLLSKGWGRARASVYYTRILLSLKWVFSSFPRKGLGSVPPHWVREWLDYSGCKVVDRNLKDIALLIVRAVIQIACREAAVSWGEHLNEFTTDLTFSWTCRLLVESIWVSARPIQLASTSQIVEMKSEREEGINESINIVEQKPKGFTALYGMLQ